ncbi:MAG: ABC transporter substrate-binding protein [Acidobacteria bacterium]|nr:ABC transporter substrate-binding protein [Acidobacteriota bacterium]
MGVRLAHVPRLFWWLLIWVWGAGVIARAQQNLIPVQVSLGDVSLNKLIFVIAQDEGIYKRNGLDVQQFITSRAAAVVARSGVQVPRQYIRDLEEDAPIAIGGGCPLMVGLTTNARAVDRVILASTDHMVRWHIVARPEITKPEQLKGKRLGYSGYGAMTHFMALVFARKMGWDPDRDVSLMSNALALETLKNGSVDAFVADEIAHTMAVAAGYKSLIDLEQYKTPIAGSGANAARSWLKNNREAARRFIKSLVEAIALMKQNKEASFRSMAKWYNITEREKQEFFYAEAANLPRKPYPAVEGIKKVTEIYNYHEMRKHKPEDFYDDSFVRELDENGHIDSLYK